MTLADWAVWAERRTALARRVIWTVLVLGLLAFVVQGADNPTDPHVVRTGAARLPLSGFDEVPFRITAPDGRTVDWCALLAATELARQQGLMGQQDLRGYDAMIFRLEAPANDLFYMYRTEIPLSIAWFDGNGAFISAADMQPCASDDPAACPRYAPTESYLYAMETERGDLQRLGVSSGSTLSFPEGPCP